MERLQRMRITVAILAVSITSLNLFAEDQKTANRMQSEQATGVNAGQPAKSSSGDRVKKEDTYQPYDYGFWWTEGPILKDKNSTLLLSKK